MADPDTPVAPAEDLTAKADAYKDEGNAHFKAGRYKNALVCYSLAIELAEGDSDDEEDFTQTTPTTPSEGDIDLEEIGRSHANFPSLHIYYSNRALCNTKLENLGSAIEDATRAICLKPSYSKAYYRRGCARMELFKYAEASKDFERVVRLSPKDLDARAKYKACKKQIQAAKFAKAIATEHTVRASETANLEGIDVPASYDGPRIEDGRIDQTFIDSLTACLKDEKTLAKKFAYQIVLEAIAYLKKQPTLCNIDVPLGKHFTVCGDIHGQFYDLLNIFKLNGAPGPENPYLFNGDFVDRGSFSLECILLLLSYKLAYPDSLFLARGNHESRNMNQLYGFKGEVEAKYDETLYNLFCEAFCLLPLAHVINDTVFVTHGGLFSKDGVTLNDIRAVDRDQEPPDSGLMTEMLWSDPMSVRGRAPSQRGVGVMFGEDVTRNFLETNNLQLVVRSHEMKDEGYEVEHSGNLITVFSAPNYCDQMGNKGAFLRFTVLTDAERETEEKKAAMANGLNRNSERTLYGNMKVQYTTFEHVPHPPKNAMHYANPALLGPMMGGMNLQQMMASSS
ncbi:Serine/threonine-protein phosphatase 5 [Perkinsus olseni]|uniref:Serine/threonine-protein phosphatase T n=1 Tax=Perkinsus olseni TaxID=32597 RepID=A0A7J6TEG2_PEROL|nr:Serine/threonine-protein phosphatase 5 [Perkinsus olseni]